MQVDGEVYTKVDVKSFRVIEELCQELGLFKGNYGIAKEEDGKIVYAYLDNFDQVQHVVLYDKPFDVKFASTLISLYKQAVKYRELSERTQDQALKEDGDYKTAYRLELRR